MSDSDQFSMDATFRVGVPLDELQPEADLTQRSFVLTPELRFVRQIGGGGFGKVYLAHLKTDGVTTEVAVKVSTRNDLEALADEANLAGKLQSSDYIGKVHQFYRIDSEPPSGIILMEYVDGRDFSRIIKSHGDLGLRIPQNYAGLVGYLACEGLDYAHQQGAIHRDIKPANIMLDRHTGAPRLIDFGLGVLAKDTPELIGEICGTLYYMAPEILRGEAYDHRVDIYSLGMTLDAFVRGESFLVRSSGSARSGSVRDRVKAIAELQEQGYEPLSRLPGVDPRLSDIVEKAVQLKPENRFQTAGEMKAAIAGYIYGHGFGPVRDVLKEYMTLVDHGNFSGHLEELKSSPDKPLQGRLSSIVEALILPGHARDYQVRNGNFVLETLPDSEYKTTEPGYLPLITS